MPAPTLTRDEAIYEIALVENALRDGYPAHTRIGAHNKSAVRIASEILGVVPQALTRRVGVPEFPLICGHHRRFGLTVDWSVYRERPMAPPVMDFAPPLAAAPPGPAPDPIETRRFKDEASRLRARLADAERRTASLEDLRGSIAGLFTEPPAPRHIFIPPRRHLREVGEIPLLNLFDLQWGEVVRLDRMGGVNAYNATIAEARIGRWLAAAIHLLTEHWHGPPPPKLYLTLGGDLVSGQIHDLPVTNDRSAPEAVRDLVGLLLSVIKSLSTALADYHGVVVPIEVISIPGNHGRIGEFPDDKRYVVDNYDTLVAWMLETHFNQPDSNVIITVPPSGDALVRIYGRAILYVHGDKIGTRGGDGGAGVAAPCARGMRKVVADYAQQGIPIYKIFMGHVHTAMELEDGFVSSSFVGPNERGRFRYRFKSMPATQWLLTMHPLYGIAQRWQIPVGDPSEGSIYEIPAGAYAGD